MYQLLTFRLRHRSVQSHIVQLKPLEPLLDQVEHRRPFREQHDLAVGILPDLLEYFIEIIELCRKRRFLLVH